MKVSLLLLLAVCIAVAACGNKGPLRLPDDNKPKQEQKP